MQKGVPQIMDITSIRSILHYFFLILKTLFYCKKFNMNNQKKLIILTGPSGVGKGTVVKEILGKDKKIWLSISATTREPREGEKEEKIIIFKSRKV